MGSVRVERRKFNKREKEIILEKTGCKCAHCGKSLDVWDMTVDHVFPIDKGGLHDEYNMLPLCLKCNEEKSNFFYPFDAYYKYVSPEEKNTFHMYNTYASFDHMKRTIMGYDEMLFDFTPDKYKEMIINMKRRGAKHKQLHDMYEKLRVNIALRRAYPANAEKIYQMIEKHTHDSKYLIKSSIYKNEYSVLKAIENGVVYILESHDHICGVFIYETLNEVVKDLDILQLNNIMEQMHLVPKYIMTYATVDSFAYEVFSDVMSYLDGNQIVNGWMPIYFDMLGKIYAHPESCIQMPFELCGQAGNIEFMTVRGIVEKEAYYMERVFRGYANYNPTEEEMLEFAEYNIKYKYQHEIFKDAAAMQFFEKYPLMIDFFKPASYELYDVGFVTEI